MAKNFSPIVAFRVAPFFRGWCVKQYRANGAWETVNTRDTEIAAKACLAERAAARGWTVDESGLHAALPQE